MERKGKKRVHREQERKGGSCVWMKERTVEQVVSLPVGGGGKQRETL